MGPIGYPEFLSDVSGQPVCPFDGTDRLSRIFLPTFRDNLCVLLAGQIGYSEFITDVSGQPVLFLWDR